MVYLAFLETTDEFPSDEIVITFHKMLEIAQRHFETNNDIKSVEILKQFRLNDPVIGEQH